MSSQNRTNKKLKIGGTINLSSILRQSDFVHNKISNYGISGLSSHDHNLLEISSYFKKQIQDIYDLIEKKDQTNP